MQFVQELVRLGALVSKTAILVIRRREKSIGDHLINCANIPQRLALSDNVYEHVIRS